LGPHSTSDDPRRYRTDAELAEWKEKDPIALLKHELLGSGRLSLAEDEKIWESAKEEISSALKIAEASAPVDPVSLFDDVFAVVPPLLAQQRDEFQRLTREGILKP
jgi:TPP-dependent pyruvate/acetoin dehydrogenase alpha subunit